MANLAAAVAGAALLLGALARDVAVLAAVVALARAEAGTAAAEAAATARGAVTRDVADAAAGLLSVFVDQAGEIVRKLT